MIKVLGHELEVIRQGFRFVYKGEIIHIVRRPGTKNYSAKIYVPVDKRYKAITTGTDDLTISVAKALELHGEIGAMQKYGHAIFSLSFDSVVKKWIEHMERRQKAKQETGHMMTVYKSALKNNILPFFAKYKMSAITRSLLEKYVQMRMGADPSSQLMTVEKNTMNLILKFARENGWYKAFDIPAIEIPKGIKQEQRRGVFLDEEIDKILEKAPEYIDESYPKTKYIKNVLEIAIHFMLATGCRTNDLIYLTWGDITFTAEDNPQKQHYVAILRGKPSKSRKSRKVMFENQIKVELDGWRKSSMNLHTKDTDLVFANKDGVFKNLDQEFSQLREAAGVPKMFQGEERTLYSLRHTFISRRLVEGVSVYDVAKQCGTSVKHIEKNYGHYLDEQLFEKIFGKKREDQIY